ncbi:MAG: phosphotransferase [Firmicutes bacterium]|nr:phosphotransferase [Bacillota bacterium]
MNGKSKQWDARIAADILARYNVTWHGWETVGPCLKVATPHGHLRLKRFAYGADEFCFVHDLAKHLQKNGFTNAEEFIMTQSGQLGVETNDGFFYLSRWQEGEVLSQIDLDTVCLVQVGGLLGEFHVASQGFSPPHGIHSHRNQWKSWPLKLKTRQRELWYFTNQARKGTTAFDQLYAQGADRALCDGRRVLAQLDLERRMYDEIAALDRKARYICHRDFIPQNLLLTPRQMLIVIDYDNAAGVERVDDIAKMLDRFSTLHINRARGLLAGYERKLPLKPEEMWLVVTYLEYPMEYWRLGRRAYRKGKPDIRGLSRYLETLSVRRLFLDELKKVR